MAQDHGPIKTNVQEIAHGAPSSADGYAENLCLKSNKSNVDSLLVAVLADRSGIGIGDGKGVPGSNRAMDSAGAGAQFALMV